MDEKDASARAPNQHWLQRWQEHNIGWHHVEYNPHLLNHWSVLELAKGSLVFTPLCGKSRDLVWLAEHGYRVRGVELSPLAVEAFFQEQGLNTVRSRVGGFERWVSGPYELYCGDIFDLASLDSSEVAAVYDRASLVALNPSQRLHYAQLMNACMPANCQYLLVAMDYAQQEMSGPPYSVTETEVRELYEARFTVNLLETLDLLKQTDRYREKGLSRLVEQIYRLVPRN
jgi:thiopurine S-methyltransferase